MNKRIEELRAENVRIHKELTELNDAARDDDEVRAFSAEEQEKWDRLHKAFEQNKVERERLEQIEKMGAYLDAPEHKAVAQKQTAEQPVEDRATENESRREEYAEAYDAYLRGGFKEHRRLTPEQVQILRSGWAPENEKRAQSVGTNSAGGFAVPDALMAALEESLLAFGGLRNAPITTLRTSDGRDLPIPTNNDTTNAGTILAENTQASDVDSTFGQVVLQAFKFTSGLIKVSQEFLEDASINVADWAVRAVGTRIARGLAPHLINGDGSGEPGGLDLAGSFVTVGGAGITRANIIDLIHAIDPAYRASPAFRLVLGDATLASIKKLATGSSDDRPLWVPSMRDGAPDTIEGVPYVVDQTVESAEVGNTSMYAGDLSKFWLREAGPVRIRRLDERYADFDQVAFVGFARYDSDIIDAGTDPIKYLRHAAS